MTKSERKLEKIHNNLYEDLWDVTEKAEPLGAPHIIVQGLLFFMDMAAKCAPNEFEARRLIKETTQEVFIKIEEEQS